MAAPVPRPLAAFAAAALLAPAGGSAAAQQAPNYFGHGLSAGHPMSNGVMSSALMPMGGPYIFTGVARYYGPNIGSSPFLFSIARPPALGPYYGPYWPAGSTGQYGDPYGPWGTVGAGPFARPAAVPALVNAVPVAGAASREEAGRWRTPALPNDAPADAANALPIAARETAAGDAAFADLRLPVALAHYDRAAAAEPDRGGHLYRAALARTASGEWADAAADLRRALELDPTLPATGPTLLDLFGDGRAAALPAAVGRAAEHARADPRDPDRLFLLAATLRAAGDDRAGDLAAAAWRLTGGAPHLRPYLAAETD